MSVSKRPHPSSKHVDQPTNTVETAEPSAANGVITATKRVRDDTELEIMDLPAAKRARTVEDEGDEVVILTPPAARDGEDLVAQRLINRWRRRMELDEMIEKKEAELAQLKLLRARLT
jgi:hypothetical protein